MFIFIFKENAVFEKLPSQKKKKRKTLKSRNQSNRNIKFEDY